MSNSEGDWHNHQAHWATASSYPKRNLAVPLTELWPMLAAAVSACCRAWLFFSAPGWGGPANHSQVSRYRRMSPWPLSALWTSAHWPFLSKWSTWRQERRSPFSITFSLRTQVHHKCCVQTPSQCICTWGSHSNASFWRATYLLKMQQTMHHSLSKPGNTGLDRIIRGSSLSSLVNSADVLHPHPEVLQEPPK